jgi:hypothetical protein
MNPTTQEQLTRALALPGAAAWCVCTPDRVFVHHCYTDWFKPAQLEAIVAKLAQAMSGLRQRQVEAGQTSWVFEHARLLVTQQPDGTTLGLFVENRPELDLTPHQAGLATFAAGGLS